MIIQNILQYYGSRLDLRLDNSEFYDFELGNDEVRMDLIDFSSGRTINYEGLVIDSECFSPYTIPLTIPIGERYTGGTCDFTVRDRTENGWTLSFLFNRNNISWSSGNTFYYCGIKNEDNPLYYLDNNLSFGFTHQSEIKWLSHHYSGYCHTTSGYTINNYISSGHTIPISGLTSNFFNVIITFERNLQLEDCNLLNDGGINDLITEFTVNNPYGTITGDTEQIEYNEILNKKWVNSRNYRLGTLKIYLNGKRIYKLNDWEETVPSHRGSTNDLVQVWGGGANITSNGIHSPNTNFLLRNLKYFEVPLNFLYIKQLYHDLYNSSVLPYITPTPTKTPSQTPTISVTPTHSVTPTRTMIPIVTSSPTPSITITPT